MTDGRLLSEASRKCPFFLESAGRGASTGRLNAPLCSYRKSVLGY